MRFFNFGPGFISWVKILYNDISSCTLNNGYASEFFPVKCVRQGCPLSPLLFIICIEILSLWIKNDKDVEGISILTQTFALVYMLMMLQCISRMKKTS